MKDFWDSRYAENGFAYGIEPNEFLKSEVHRLKRHSKILCLSEGEGRNALYLARNGHFVTAVDISSVGMNKAKDWASLEKLKLETVVADLNDYDMGEIKWDAIISIFGHLPHEIRRKVHQKILNSLKPGGLFILEAYTEEQLMLKTGGPKDKELMMSLAIIESELKELKTVIKRTCIREIHEGKYHNGISAVVQYIGQKV
jgi:SAM-dependent methyltransferase